VTLVFWVVFCGKTQSVRGPQGDGWAGIWEVIFTVKLWIYFVSFIWKPIAKFQSPSPFLRGERPPGSSHQHLINA